MKRLRDDLRKYKAHGERSVASVDEAIESLSEVLRTGTDSAKIQAAKSVLEHHRRSVQRTVAADQAPRLIDAACGPDRSLFLQVLGLSAGLAWKRNGMQNMADWEPPDHLAEIAERLKAHDPSPTEFLDVLVSKT